MSSVHIMLMENALQVENEEKLKFIFDLKGSTVNRSVTGKLKNTTTRKDVCFLKTKKAYPKLMKIDPDDKERILTIINKDVEFLRRNGLMDYSLLLAVEKASDRNDSLNTGTGSGGQQSKKNTIVLKSGDRVADYVGELISQVHSHKTGKRIFHIAIIDYLQTWTTMKKLERASKTMFLGVDGARLSAIEPQAYARRFKSFMARHLFN